MLIEYGADPYIPIKQGKNLFLTAIETHNNKALDILVQYGIKPTPKNISHIITKAIERNNIQAIEFFIRNGFDPKTHEEIGSIITRAVEKNSNSSLELLLKHGADPDARSKYYPDGTAPPHSRQKK